MTDTEATQPDPEEATEHPSTKDVSPGEPSSDALVGSRIGPYRILRLIAEGGMGSVYLAEREDHFKQRVALKMIHSDKISDGLLERFYAERQILADLEHPNIARIFDGGATHGTLPFFVMEFVEGEPFDRACADLSLHQRLKLFQKVCYAVHHAHRSLIVHRDLKPSNILVTAKDEPKLLDFGIAKLLRQEKPQEERQHDHTGMGPMTIAFASPEQLAGETITISTDIYSLGVLLYTILSGQHPYRAFQGSTQDLVFAILCETPPPPSELAPRNLARRVVGDLDAIVCKAMSKEPEERYDSAAQLAEEIQLHLDDLPIRAWPGTWLSRLRKSARRNKLTLALMILLLAFSTTVSVLWRHAVEQQVEAERAQTRVERTQEFILEFFTSIEPDHNPGPGVDLKKVLDSGRHTLEKSLHEEPEVRADLLGTIAKIYSALALHEDAFPLQEEAVALRRALQPTDHRSLAGDLTNLGNSYYALGEYQDAEKVLREALSLWNQLGDPYEINAMANLAAPLLWQKKTDEVIDLCDRALERAAELSLENEPNMAPIFYVLGATHKRQGNLEMAEPHLRRSLSIYTSNPETKPSKLAQVSSSLGETLQYQGRPLEALPHLEKALAIRFELFGDLHPDTAASQRKLALLLLDLGEYDTAEGLLTQASDTYSTLQDEQGAADVRNAQKRLAEQELRQAAEVGGKPTDASAPSGPP